MPSKRKKFAKKYRRNADLPGRPKSGRPPGVPWSGAKKNPADAGELLEEALAGFAGFGGTRIISRLAGAIAAKKNAKLAPWVSVGAGLGSLLILWAAAHRVKKTAPFAVPLVVGSAIANLQTIVQTVFPKYGWLVGHASEDGGDTKNLPSGTGDSDYDKLLDDSSEGDEYTYDESMDTDQKPAKQNGNGKQAAAPAKGKGDGDELEELMTDLEDEDFGSGIFAN